MTFYQLTVAIVLGSVLSTSAFAQETSAPADTTAEATSETPANTEEAAVAEPEGPEIGKTYVESVHGDWELRCITAPEGQSDPCQLYQLLQDQNGNSVAEINLFNMPGDDKIAAGATIVTPLETLLTRNLVITVDSGESKAYPFTFCTAIGCFARVGFTAAEVNAFKRGKAAKIVIVPAQAPNQTVDLTASLTGFTSGFNAVTASTQN